MSLDRLLKTRIELCILLAYELIDSKKTTLAELYNSDQLLKHFYELSDHAKWAYPEQIKNLKIRVQYDEPIIALIQLPYNIHNNDIHYLTHIVSYFTVPEFGQSLHITEFDQNLHLRLIINNKLKQQ